ncbi:hypothetical protein [Staphylococcus felis]|uniref:Uncharacterized protein n=1 Tax=Staphylococcus felis TaxID=46127 RepID=A0A3E0INZ6_9STAP|nr:hypothetical protein [Staphylococcus felis]REH94322.1 hypothetical protein DOS83_07685 [Staphylococcus felis]
MIKQDKYEYIRPQNLKDIGDEIQKIIDYKRYEKLKDIVEHINDYVEAELDIFPSDEIYELMINAGDFD